MSKQKKKGFAPALQFSEFQKKNEWEEIAFGKAFVRLTEKNKENNQNVLTISAQLGLVSQLEYFNKKVSAKDVSGYYLLHKGDFAYNKSYSKGYPMGAIKPLKEYNKGVVSTLYIGFRTKEGYQSSFFEQYFDSGIINSEIEKIAQEGGRAHGLLNVSVKEFFTDIKIYTPQAHEQKKIADCLSSIDDLITAQNQKIDALKAQRKGLMQHLFPAEGETVPKLRFPEFRRTGDWNSRKIEKLAKRGSGHTPNKKHTENYGGGIKWVSLADSKKLDSGYIHSTNVDISQEGLDNSSAVLHPAGSVIISRDAGVGKSAVLYEAMAVSQHFIAWQCDSKILSNWFLYYFLQLMKPAFENIAVGNAIKTIGLPYFKELSIAVPSIDEQDRIAECLLSIDEIIYVESKKYESLKSHKKGLMQQLFPSLGEVEL